MISDERKRVELSAHEASGTDNGRTLVPMLVIGLGLVVVGAVIVVLFV